KQKSCRSYRRSRNAVYPEPGAEQTSSDRTHTHLACQKKAYLPLLNEYSFSIIYGAMIPVKKAAVLGAGTMGAQIAAHLANAGIPTLLLDIPPRELSADELAQ